MQNWRVANPEFDRNMSKIKEHGALDFFVNQTESPNSIISQDLRDRAFQSIGNTVQLPVINYDGNVTVGSARTCTIADAENTSALYSVVFSTYQVGFTMVPAAYSNNEISYEQDWNRKMQKSANALANALDQSAITALAARKTTVFADLLYYTETGDVVQVPWSMRQEIVGDLDPIMRANNFPGSIHLIGNGGVDSLLRKMAEHGLYNDVNKQFEFEGKTLYFTNNITNDVGKFATMYAVEDGNVGMLTRVDREALLGSSANGHEWSIATMPYLNIPVGTHYYTAVGDQSGIAGAATADLTCGVKEYFGFSVDVAFIVAYNSDETTIANPIVKVEISSSASANPFATAVEVVNTAVSPVITQGSVEVTNTDANPVKTQAVSAGV